MTARLDDIGFRILMVEVAELADPDTLKADPKAVQDATVRLAGTVGPSLFACAAVQTLACIFDAQPQLRQAFLAAGTAVVREQTAAAAKAIS